MSCFAFTSFEKDEQTKARCGLIETAHGSIETPAFMPVGTRGAVKTLTNQQLLELDAKIILGNTYHLLLRPGKKIIEKAGGLHALMQWPRPLLTDSGGFQVFSLGELNRITEEGVHFQSHIDGARYFIGPHQSMEMQKAIGADIVMAFDECSPYPATKEQIEQAMERTHRWAKVCRDYPLKEHQTLFGIVQGGMDKELRIASAKEIVSLGFAGYAIGGLSVGEPYDLMYEMIDATIPFLPLDRPRYLMGVGTPRNIVEAVMRGVDLFDCVMPTRNARNGTAFTWEGKIIIKAGRYAEDFSPLDAALSSYASSFSKAYVRHLLNVGEITGLTLVSMQNIAFYLDFMQQLRQSIKKGELLGFYDKICKLYPVYTEVTSKIGFGRARKLP